MVAAGAINCRACSGVSHLLTKRLAPPAYTACAASFTAQRGVRWARCVDKGHLRERKRPQFLTRHNEAFSDPWWPMQRATEIKRGKLTRYEPGRGSSSVFEYDAETICEDNHIDSKAP